MPPKKKTPAPIDRPLSRAYLRGFTGWSTAFPPGQSEPTSLRVMENMFVDRNGALAIRPGLKYLSYMKDPLDSTRVIALDRPMVGSQEPFYTSNGDKALLFAVRETDDTVGFRVILFSADQDVVRPLTDPDIGFTIPQGETTLRFSAATTHVKYLQIDNKIIAMSDAGEAIRLFFVGAEKIAKRLSTVSVPLWEDSNKLTVRHPDASWVLDQTVLTRRNSVVNPSFEAGGEFWAKSSLCAWRLVQGSTKSGTNKLGLSSLPSRTNMVTSPLHSVGTTGLAGWSVDAGVAKISGDGGYMKVYDAAGAGDFWSFSSKMSYGVQPGGRYRLAFDFTFGSHVKPFGAITFYNASGAKIGSTNFTRTSLTPGRHVSAAVTAPAGSVTVRVSLGGTNTTSSATYVKFKGVSLVRDGESTGFFHGSSGTNYFWTGAANASASVYHPPTNVQLWCNRAAVAAGAAICASIHVSSAAAKTWILRLRAYDKNVVELAGYESSGTATAGGAWVRAVIGTATSSAAAVAADMRLTINSVARGETVYVDAAMLEYGVSTAGTYFDGSTAPTTGVSYQWADRSKPHRTFSTQITKTVTPDFPPAETPTTKTLIATGGAASNPYKIGLFYTFENEVGESSASKIVEVRTSRPWSNWEWETPNAAGEPSGTETSTAELCADQLVAIVPSSVFAQAVAEGAIRWNLYAFAWSDQDAVPVVAQLVADRDLYADGTETPMINLNAVDYGDLGWIAITPARRISSTDVPLPTRENRVNYSRPPKTRNGLVAGDRLIVVGDLDDAATIRWSSGSPGNYTNFSATRGGGAKTLTSGNQNIPAAVVLWQNPQSVDTLTILCLSADGQSASYYMQPAAINAQSGAASIMGFEETTSTPGTVAAYGAQVLNNALYRPTDRALLKSTASNYNISHKSQTDKIANMWWRLQSKKWIMSAQLDNRLYYLVHHPIGEELAEGCRGNEIWVYDTTGGEAGHWSRLLIQGTNIRVFSLGDKEYLGVTTPDGLFYLDPDTFDDDYVSADGTVMQRPIPWRFETNTQGANRAHDAWAHLQQVQIALGSFKGTMRYGIRGHDLNHRDIEVSKEMQDLRQELVDGSTWDIEDVLQVRRDLKEWAFFGSSVPDKHSRGILGYVQYRYAPVSVNVGYEYGSVETFEYGTNVVSGPTIYSDNGIPVPVTDYTRS